MLTAGGLGLAVVLGAVLGLAGGWAFWGRTPDRVETALALLEDRCGPYVLDQRPFDASGLVAAARAPAGQFWVEPQSRLAVDPSGRDCAVTDALAPFGPEERSRFAAGAEALGLRLLPGSTATTPDGVEGWPIVRLIAARVPGEAEAVLILSRHAETDDQWVGQTSARLSRPLREGRG